MVDRFSTRAISYVAMGLCAISLTACATPQAHSGKGVSKNEYRASIGAFANPAGGEDLDPVAAAAFWGTRYNRDQSVSEPAVKFSSALRKIGSVKEAVGVMQKASVKFPRDTDVSLEYGKALIQDSRAFEAVRHIETAAAQYPDEWTILSAYGVALDQIGEHKTARQKYDRALALAPGAVSVLNNKGLSYALDGDLDLARQTLRVAAASPGASSRIRQNLALVLAISGDMKDAERLARSDLPPQVADNNIDFFRAIVNQPAYWDEYAETGVEVPAFDAAPAQPAPQPKPQLLEPPKQENNNNDGEPIALIETTPVTNASVITGPIAVTVQPSAGVDEANDAVSEVDADVAGVELKKDD